MGRGKTIGIGVGIAIGVIIALGIIGASISNPSSQPSIASNQENPGIADGPADTVSSSNTNQSPQRVVTATSVSRIDRLFVLGSSSENAYQARFTLVDANQAELGEDGDVSFVIVDSANRSLYERNFSVKKNDFQTYQLVLTGQPFLAYVWEFPTSDVRPGIGTFGTAKVTFTSNDGQVFTSTYDAVSIPKLSDEEVKKIYEEEYLKTAKEVGSTVTKGSFQITLVRVGWYEHLAYDTWGDPVTDFRADITIKNIGPEPEYIPSSFVIIDGNGNQYDSNFRGTITFREIYPGVTVQGYELFEGLGPDTSHIRLFTKDTIINESTYRLEDIYWEFEVDI